METPLISAARLGHTAVVAAELAGGADLDEDVEASLQHVIAERARQTQELDAGRPSASTTFDLNSLLCCAARKVA